MASKCIFCKKEMNNKLEQHIKACNNCTVLLLMKRHNLVVKKPKTPISFSMKKYNKEWINVWKEKTKNAR
jgi:DNA-directed RNA polymerase subunit RPC12/RpoP